jgi:protoporphyrinogen IX oxidase
MRFPSLWSKALSDWVVWVKALHVASVIAWMAALFYLPRLFVYHVDAPKGSQQSETFKLMERRLLKAIMNPAMIAVWITGPLIAIGYGEYRAPWLHAKLLLVLLLSGFHGYLVGRVRAFANDANDKPARFYRLINEIPTVLMLGIVVLVVVKPF